MALAGRVVGRYDLAVSTQSGDRPTGFAIIAARHRVAPVERRFSGRIKRTLLTRSVAYDPRVHRVEAMLRLADTLGIPRVSQVVPPQGGRSTDLPSGDYAVIHAAPMFNYKRWTAEGWRALASALTERGLSVVATGGPGETERKYLDDVWSRSSVIRYDGKLTWAALSSLLSRARLFVGPDTSVTHLAVASGCPTVALYGPTDPRLWGPWPVGGLQENWVADSSLQNRGNVWLIQNQFPCVPCQLEGCERNVESTSQCLMQLSSDSVISVVDQLFASAVAI
jgi:heptosyltransferase-3